MVHYKSLKKELLDKHLNKIFIETGTQYGFGIEVALQCDFEKIYSIDIDSKYHAHCTNKFKEQIETNQIELWIGDSAKMLGNILDRIKEPITFWLDAHGGAGGGTGTVCPLLNELKQIQEHSIDRHTILIDDRRMFGKVWGVGLKEDDVISLLKEINPEYKIEYANGCEPKDIIVAYV
ncbi:MAG: hypothetical protein EBT86_05985 [Actinobacteria bacterium]|nr:hypothetical protein [Actinomycetota bacterium]